jgi:hypothetical protein
MKISYQRSYSIGPFLQEKIGFEIELDTPDPVKEVEFLKNMCDEANRRLNPNYPSPNESPQLSESQPIKEVQIDREIGVKAEDILSCKDKNTLLSYRFLLKTDELRNAYGKRMEEIENQQLNELS